MAYQTLAHISDLHVGRSPSFHRALYEVRDALTAARVDHVVLTGDLTHRGRADEWHAFERVFGPLMAAGRLTLVPGNHDRLGDDIGAFLMNERVEVAKRPGLYLVRIDSTGPHNRFLLSGHGEICDDVLDALSRALDAAPPGDLVVVMLHHHPLPLPEETLPERLASRLGWPYAAELRLGLTLLERLRGRCDLVLHGHRHVPRSLDLWVDDARPLGLYNAGCTPELGRFRLFAHRSGKLVEPPVWTSARDSIAEPVLLATGTY